jgi:phytoene/squalene synthetase
MTIDACAALVERGDPDRFAAAMATPPAARAKLFPLYAFNLEVARAPWVSKEAMIAEMRLQWWRDVVAEPTPRAHEVAGPLHGLIKSANLPLEVFDRLIEARRHATSGGLMWLCASALGASPAAEPAIRAYAYATGIARYLQAVPDLEDRGRMPLPDGRPEAVRALAGQALSRLHIARAYRSGANRRGIPSAALLSGWQTEPLLRRVLADPNCVANGTLALSEFTRRSHLAWQALSGRW